MHVFNLCEEGTHWKSWQERGEHAKPSWDLSQEPSCREVTVPQNYRNLQQLHITEDGELLTGDADTSVHIQLLFAVKTHCSLICFVQYA